jgi:hypothetical protein
MLLSAVLVALSTFKASITSATAASNANLSAAAIEPSDNFLLDKWVEVFEGREGDVTKGGIKIHRLLEVDPLPPQNPTRIVSVCLKYSEKLAQLPKNRSGADLNAIKLAFWSEIRPWGLSLLHPLCAKVMADCGEALSANELIDLIEEHEFLICNNHDLVSKIPDYSLLSPDQVLSIFESPIALGLNLSKIPNVLRTLRPESLIKLMEMVAWDIEDWEMRVLVDARGGVEGLIKDLDGHLNSWSLLIKFPWVMQQVADFTPLKSSVDRLLIKLESRNYSKCNEKNQLFIALINLILSQEFLLSRKNVSEEMSKAILNDKMRLNRILKESEDFGMLYVLSTTPLSSNTVRNLEEVYEKELPETFGLFIDYWKQLITTNLGDTSVYVYGLTARTLVGIVISNYSDEEVDSVIEFYQENRLNVFHIESMSALKRTWPLSEKVNQLELKFFGSDELFTERSIEKLRNICREASGFYSNFLETRFDHFKLRDSICSWVEFQMRLQSAGALIKQYDQMMVAKRLLPLLLEDEKIGTLIQEYPNIFLSSDVIDILLLESVSVDDDQAILRRYPRLLHGLIDYKQFSGTNFQSLPMDFSKIRRGLSTIPMIQMINFMKSKQGLIDDPIGFLAAIPKSAWESKSFIKHFSMYFRVPMLIEDLEEYLQYIDVAFIGPQIEFTDTKSLLWSVVKFVINTEILYQELKVVNPANLTGNKAKILNFLIRAESFHRNEATLKLTKEEIDEESLCPFYAVVIKTIQSVPLSLYRLEKIISTATGNGIKVIPSDLLLLNMFPSFSLKSGHKNYSKSLQNFKILIKKLGETEEIKTFWLYLLAVCSGDLEEIKAMLDDERIRIRIPIYYRVLGKRIIT